MDAAAGADLHSLIELWLETKEIERLVEKLREARDEELEGISHYATEPVAKELAKTHPDVAAKVCRALGMRILFGSSTASPSTTAAVLSLPSSETSISDSSTAGTPC